MCTQEQLKDSKSFRKWYHSFENLFSISEPFVPQALSLRGRKKKKRIAEGVKVEEKKKNIFYQILHYKNMKHWHHRFIVFYILYLLLYYLMES